MFCYYALHSIANQLRRFVRTWAFVLLLVMVVLGGVAWRAALWYYQRLREVDATLPSNLMELFEGSGLTTADVIELALGFLILGILVLQLFGAEKSVSRLFLQADVNMLFPSPRSPQQILAFRVASTLSMAIAAVPLMLLGLPTLMSSLGIGPYAALTLPLAWCLTLAYSALLKMLVYELGTRHPFVRSNLRWLVLGVLGALGVGFYLAYDASAERSLLVTAQGFLNAPWTRAIPVWGWIKGLVVLALEGRTGASLGLLALNAAALGLLGLAAWRCEADYYEETLGWAEEMARFRKELSNDNAPLLVLGLARRHRRDAREGFGHGSGAGVYFFKVLHQRQRFSRFGIVTRTMGTYLFAAIAAGLFVRLFMDEALPYVPALVLCAMVFFRTVISPVTEDIRKDGFLLLPEPIWAKLLFSLLGGSCNCALDVAIPLMAGSVVAGFAPWEGLAYLPALVSVDFFASAAGAFADVSIPPSIGVSLKQVIQVLLLYFGLMFDGMVVTYGIGSGNDAVGFVLASALNLLLGGAFLGLAGVWLYPHRGRPIRKGGDQVDVGSARSAYARVGLALACMLVAIRGGQLLLAPWAPPHVSLYLPIYGFGLPVFLAIAGRGGARPAARGLGVPALLAILAACLFVGYAGSVVGLALQGALRLVLPTPLVPRPTAIPEGHLLLQLLLVTVASPFMEELVFRRCLLDRLGAFGERTALVVSSLAFGLFHGNVNQLCYGFLIGLVLGYVYLRTGRLRYSAMVHVTINTLSSVVLPALLLFAEGSVEAAGMDPSHVVIASVILEPGVLALLLYLALLFALSLFGAVVFAFGARERQLPAGGVGVAVALTTTGMLFFGIVAVVAML